MARVHAFTDDALGDLDAVGLVAALAAGHVSIPEVVEAAIARTEQVAPTLNALAIDCFDRARAEAADPRGGYFAGVPTFLKDNVDLAGFPTMQGADAFDPRPAKRDGDFARMFLATGVIPLGKTQLSEFGFSASAEHARLGSVRSPWSTEHTAGASSAGSAAFVAAGAVPLAHANDGGGSIRIPAAINGLVGLKPTRGRLAQDRPLRQMPVRIVSDGVLTRSVRDSAAFLREAERVYRDLRLAPVGDVRGPGRARRSVAVVTDGIDVTASPEVTDAHPEDGRGSSSRSGIAWSGSSSRCRCRSRTTSCSTGRRSPRSSPPPGGWSTAARGTPRSSTASPRGWTTTAAATSVACPARPRRLRRSGRLAEELHGRYDVVLTPTLAHETPEVGWLDPAQGFDTVMSRLLEWVAFTPWQNATGTPAVSLPLATTATGLPLGMMLAAGRGGEAMLLELAYELEESQPWPLLRDA